MHVLWRSDAQRERCASEQSARFLRLFRDLDRVAGVVPHTSISKLPHQQRRLSRMFKHPISSRKSVGSLAASA